MPLRISTLGTVCMGFLRGWRVTGQHLWPLASQRSNEARSHDVPVTRMMGSRITRPEMGQMKRTGACCSTCMRSRSRTGEREAFLLGEAATARAARGPRPSSDTAPEEDRSWPGLEGRGEAREWRTAEVVCRPEDTSMRSSPEAPRGEAAGGGGVAPPAPPGLLVLTAMMTELEALSRLRSTARISDTTAASEAAGLGELLMLACRGSGGAGAGRGPAARKAGAG